MNIGTKEAIELPFNDNFNKNNQQNFKQKQQYEAIDWNNLTAKCKLYIRNGFTDQNVEDLKFLFAIHGLLHKLVDNISKANITRNQLRKYYDEMIILRDKFESGTLNAIQLRENLEILKPLLAYSLIYRKSKGNREDNNDDRVKFVNFMNETINEIFSNNNDGIEQIKLKYGRFLNIFQTIVAYSKEGSKND